MADTLSSFFFGKPAPAGPAHITSPGQLDAIREECLKAVTRRAGIAAAAGAVPIPLLDLGTDTILLQRLNAEVTSRFGLTPEQFQAEADADKAAVDSEDKKLLAMMLTNLSGQMLGKGILKNAVVKGVTRVGEKVFSRRLTRLVPLVGPAVSAGLSFGTMKVIGDRHVEECYAIARRLLDKGPNAGSAPVAALTDVGTPGARAVPDANLTPPAEVTTPAGDAGRVATEGHLADAVSEAGAGPAFN